MAKTGDIIETRITRFDGGMVGDARNPRPNTCRASVNFDAISNPFRLTPYQQSESGDSSASTSKKRNFQIALRTGTTYSLYALGVQSGNTRAEILYKNITVSGAANDMNDATWDNTGVHQSGAGTSTDFDLFKYYQKTGRIYGARDGTHIWSYDPAGSVAFNDTELAVTYTNIEQGIVHSHDDILYIPIDNKIYRNDSGDWSNGQPVLTIPSHYQISAICEYGTRIAIAAIPISGFGNSRVFIWSRDAGTEFLIDSIDWGEGRIEVLEEVEGFLLGVSVLESAAGTSSSILRRKVQFKYFNDAPGGVLPTRGAKLIDEFTGSGSMGLIRNRQKRYNRVHFMMVITMDGIDRGGVWSIGLNRAGQWAITLERTHDNTTTATSVDFYNFIYAGDYLFQAYVSGGAFALSKTDEDPNTYASNSAIYITKILNADDSSLKKDLIGVSVTTEPLTTSGTYTLGYKIDDTIDDSTAFTTIFTEGTDNSISFATTASLPKDYKELALRIVSTGVEITGISLKERVAGKKSYT